MVFLFDMNLKNLIFLFSTFLLKETLSSQSIPSSYEYDITKTLDQWFAKIFQVDGNTGSVRDSFGSALNYKLPEVEYNLDHEVKPFEDRFIFQDVTFCRHGQDESGTSRISKMICNFPESKISVFMERLRITLEAQLRARNDTPYVKLFTTLIFRNFTLTATGSSKNHRNTSIDFSYDAMVYPCVVSEQVDIQWSGEQTLSSFEKEELTEEIKPALVAMLRENINCNSRFSSAFKPLFSTTSKIVEDIVSAYPDILDQKQKYYYLIPQIPFFCFKLKNIRIRGLPNIELLTVYKLTDIFTHTLLIRNIRGDMLLDYGSVKGAPEPLELVFEVDYLAISILKDRHCAHVEAKYYSVNSTANGPLNRRQETELFQRIESAIVTSIMPSREAWRFCDIKTPIDKLKSCDGQDWKTIKAACKDWIPV